MDLLWLKLSDDTSLPESLDPKSRDKLQALFDGSDPRSAWSRALSELGLRWPGGPVLKWDGDTVYVNGSALTELVSAGWIRASRTQEGGQAYSSRTRLNTLPSLIKSQWKVDNFIAHTLKADLPVTDAAQIDESLKLGLALQSLLLRLPRHEPTELASWLAGAVEAPAKIRKVLALMQQLQIRRTRLSPAWLKCFSGSTRSSPESTVETMSAGPWQGLPVHAGRRSGHAWLVDRDNPGAQPKPPFIAVFAQARPSSVEHYEGAAGLVFGEGGVLSHACSVAREQRIPSVTAAGSSLIAVLRGQPKAWLTIDG